MIGRIDMKRDGGVLAVRAFWPEAGVQVGSGRFAALHKELERAARFGGCGAVGFTDGWMRPAN